MNARQFRLAAVLRVRRLQEERARLETAAATARAAGAARHASETAAAVSAAGRVAVEATGSALVARRGALLGAATSARRDADAAATAAAAADDVRRGWHERHRDVGTLESLQERHDEGVRVADQRAAQQVGDELALVRWGRGR